MTEEQPSSFFGLKIQCQGLRVAGCIQGFGLGEYLGSLKQMWYNGIKFLCINSSQNTYILKGKRTLGTRIYKKREVSILGSRLEAWFCVADLITLAGQSCACLFVIKMDGQVCVSSVFIITSSIQGLDILTF